MEGSWLTPSVWLPACEIHPRSAKRLNKTDTFFFGDSNMFRLFRSFRDSWSCNPVTRGTRCGLVEHLKLTPRQQRTSPDVSVEGPLRFGLWNAGCSDCWGCNPEVVRCGQAELQYFPMEFFRDVEVQTPTWDHTQDVLFREKFVYLKERDDVNIVIGGGVHDLSLSNVFQIVDNTVDHLIDLLGSYAARKFWVTTTHIDDEKQPPEWRHISNCASANRLRWIVRHHIEKTNSSRFFVVDGFKMSLGEGLTNQSLHEDGVHFQPSFYDALRDVLLEMA